MKCVALKNKILNFAYLTRITSGGKLVPEIDGLRFVAIIGVVVFHILETFLLIKHNIHPRAVEQQNWIVHILSHGNYGVQIFFVISGFILSLPFARERISCYPNKGLKSYYVRRISRLVPPYFINLAIIYFLMFVIYGTAIEMLPNFIASLFYQHGLILGEFSKISNVTWSLEVEVQFYLLAPLLAFVFKVSDKHIRRFILFVIMIASSYWSNLIRIDSRLYLSVFNYSHYFISGFILTDIYLVDWKENPNRYFTGDIISLLGISLMLMIIFDAVDEQFFLPISILIIFIGVFTGRISNFIFSRKLLTTIGGMCYTIYLYHQLIIFYSIMYLFKTITTITGRSNDLLKGFDYFVFIMLSIVLIISVPLFAFFERPFMKKIVS